MLDRADTTLPPLFVAGIVNLLGSSYTTIYAGHKATTIPSLNREGEVKPSYRHD